ncbi:MAG TPA: hypothetical protein VKB77_13325 [Terriglobales bacterium]|nr:hypothetical protein [Terriglobales bacterium]
MRKPEDATRSEPTIHIKAGEKVEFPVAAKHPLAKFQTVTAVRAAEDVQEFLALWAQNAAVRDEPAPDTAAVVAHLRKVKLGLLRLFTKDLRIDKGAVVTLNNPLNQLEFDNVLIAGDLVVRGDLVLKCNALTIE